MIKIMMVNLAYPLCGTELTKQMTMKAKRM